MSNYQNYSNKQIHNIRAIRSFYFIKDHWVSRLQFLFTFSEEISDLIDTSYDRSGILKVSNELVGKMNLWVQEYFNLVYSMEKHKKRFTKEAQTKIKKRKESLISLRSFITKFKDSHSSKDTKDILTPYFDPDIYDIGYDISKTDEKDLKFFKKDLKPEMEEFFIFLSQNIVDRHN